MGCGVIYFNLFSATLCLLKVWCHTVRIAWVLKCRYWTCNDVKSNESKKVSPYVDIYRVLNCPPANRNLPICGSPGRVRAKILGTKINQG